MTNFERIKGMSVEELAEILIQYDEEYGVYTIYGTDEWFGDDRYTYKEVIKRQIEVLEREVKE